MFVPIDIISLQNKMLPFTKSQLEPKNLFLPAFRQGNLSRSRFGGGPVKIIISSGKFLVRHFAFVLFSSLFLADIYVDFTSFTGFFFPAFSLDFGVSTLYSENVVSQTVFFSQLHRVVHLSTPPLPALITLLTFRFDLKTLN